MASTNTTVVRPGPPDASVANSDPRRVVLQQPTQRSLERQPDGQEYVVEKTIKAEVDPPTAEVTTSEEVHTLPPLEVRCLGRTRVPTPHGEVFCHLYRSNRDAKEHLALVFDPAQNHASIQEQQEEGTMGKPRHLRSRTLDAVWHANETPMERLIRGAYVDRLSPTCQEASQPSVAESADLDEDQAGFANPLVRIHSECYTGETIGSQRCDCGEQLDEALRRISLSSTKMADGRTVPARGVVVYMRQEGRGIGLLDKLCAYNLQDMGHDTVTANVMLGHLPDARKYDISSAILRDLGINACRLLTNNPEKMQALAAEGIHVSERVPVIPRVWQTQAQGPKRARRRPRLLGSAGTRTNSVVSLDRTRAAPTPPRASASPMPVSELRASASPMPVSELSDDSDWDDEVDEQMQRSQGVTLIGGSMTQSTDLERYLRTKVEKMGHMLVVPDTERATPESTNEEH